MTDQVTYEALVSTGNYSHLKIAVTLDREKGESITQAMARARAQVRNRIKADLKAMGDLNGWS